MFSLVKFSHHTGPCSDRSHTWTHVNNRNDLELTMGEAQLIDEFANHVARSWMKVTSGNEVLESQDLYQLVIFSQQHTIGERPVDIVVKSPFLAMKYPKTPSTVRRIQVKFRKESDFSQAVNFLRSLGLSVVDKEAPTSLSSGTFPGPTIVPSISGSASNISLTRPLTLGEFSFQPNGSSQQASLLPAAENSLSSQMRPGCTVNEGPRAAFLKTTSPSSLSSTKASKSSISSQYTNLFQRVSNLEEAKNQTSSLYQSQIESRVSDKLDSIAQENYNNNLQHQDCNASHQQTGNSGFETLNSEPRITHVYPQDEKIPIYPSKLVTLAEAPALLYQPERRGNIGDNFAGQSSQNNPEPLRLVATQPECSEDKTVWIPPRRELPFSMPRSQPKTDSPHVESLSPLPKPTPIERVDLKQPVNSKKQETHASSKRPVLRKSRSTRPTMAKISKKINSPKSAEQTTPVNIDHGVEKSPSSSENTITTAATPLVSVKERPPLRATAPSKKRPAPQARTASKRRTLMVDQSTQTFLQTLSFSRDVPAQKIGANYTVTDPNTAPTSLESPRTDFINSLEDILINIKNRPAPKEVWEKPGYLEAGDESRIALVNDFICENLGNPEFLQLCQDTEFSWRRIGLGLSK